MSTRLSIFVIVTFFVGLGFLWQAAQFPASHEVSTLVGPRTWPFGVLVLLLGLVVVMALLLWTRGAEQFTGPDEVSGSEPDAAVQRDHLSGRRWPHLMIFGLALGYSLIMALTGYLLATAIFAATATVVLGERRPLRVVLNTVIAVAIVALVFDRLLNIPLP
ncbi:tripartite tricarboxylate transporter TctB family protein [Palleronia sp. LCG004]|uniref:tripartite tricarboxylate transporter TctB family protein n=1 Tax=Palleronia sp. LCG004 TaxID=3079304 RepID=UPI002943251F|nr:tripartite tricarboxylate transporter TctB family protein [Palleronia sp. LCG004]WOI58318.1 tripartite tricarboxylate transporter TctB family protein [Palleronia sp. LCG004]